MTSETDINAQGWDGKTALMIAAEHGDDHAAAKMRSLIDTGADTNIQDDNGWTALMIAAEWGGGVRWSVEMISTLIDAGADPNKQRNDGKTALMFVAEDGGEHGAVMMKVLLDAGADANLQTKDGSTALTIAAENWGRKKIPCYTGMVRLLIAHGASATPPRSRWGGAFRFADLLTPELTEYIDGTRNWTPLHRAADARDAKKLHKLLCESTTHPNDAVDSPHPDMRTALEIAGSSSYPTAQPVCEECLALLQPSLVKGVVPSQSNSGGGGGGGSLFTTE